MARMLLAPRMGSRLLRLSSSNRLARQTLLAAPRQRPAPCRSAAQGRTHRSHPVSCNAQNSSNGAADGADADAEISPPALGYSSIRCASPMPPEPPCNRLTVSALTARWPKCAPAQDLIIGCAELNRHHCARSEENGAGVSPDETVDMLPPVDATVDMPPVDVSASQDSSLYSSSDDMVLQSAEDIRENRSR